MAALFGKKKEVPAEADEKKVTKTPVAAASKSADTKSTAGTGFQGRENIARVLTQPRITEKATMGIEKGVYVFDVAPDANKKQIKEAIKMVYDVEPVKVHVTTIAKKGVRNARTGIKGVKSGGKKAYVYLKKGDTISIM